MSCCRLFPGPSQLLCLLLLLGFAVSCAPRTAPVAPGAEEPQPETALHPDQVWKRFQNRSVGGPQAAEATAFTCEASLHYSGPKAKSRVRLRFWGNLARPLRLELSTSLGSTVALWREDDMEFLAYLPDKETAYLHRDGRLGMAAFGINLPFTLRELALLLNGRIAELIPQRYTTVRKTKDDEYLFTLVGEDRRFSLLLDKDGEPLGMSTLTSDPWSLEFLGSLADQGMPGLPEKIRMQRASGEQAILFIKQLEQRSAPFPADKLELELPPDTRVMILENTAPAAQ